MTDTFDAVLAEIQQPETLRLHMGEMTPYEVMIAQAAVRFAHSRLAAAHARDRADARRWRAYVAGRAALDPSHVCRACGHPYTPEAGESEDCPNCGHDGSAIDAHLSGGEG